MTRPISLASSFVHKAFAFVLIAAGLAWLPSPAVAQTYMFGQASLQTGTKPSGLAVADFNGDGRADLAVANQGDNTVSVILTQQDGTFAAKVDYPVGKSPLQVVTSDFNGDGIMDLAVVNSADNTVSLLFGVGDGTFASQTTFPTGKAPVAIAAGDFNGDGNVDLAVANQSDDTVSVFLGNGKGAFTGQPTVPISGPYYLLSGDVNNDGKADLFVLGSAPSSSTVLFLLTSAGGGSFSVAPIGAGTSITNIALGDLNNDGNLDVVFADSSSDSVNILLGTGAGTFASQSLSTVGPLGGPPRSVAVGDFTHNGNLDLAVTQTYFIAVYPGSGNGTFGSPLLGGIPSFTIPLLLVPADFNNDAQLDLAAIVPDYNVALILLGNGDGTLASRADVTLPASGGLVGSVVADFNNDGKQDLAIAQYNQPLQGSIQGFIATLLGNGDGTFQKPASSPMSDVGTGEMISADFTGNGNADLASADVNADGGIAVFLGSGNGMFGSPIDSFMGGATTMNPGPLATGDFNRDGKVDLILGSEDTGNNSSPLYVLLSQGDGTFKANFIYDLAYGVVPDVAVADFNRDGFLDLAVTTQNEVLVFLGRGDGTFQAPVPYTNANPFINGIVSGDFNSDGKPDFVVGTSGTILFYAGNGDGTFRSPVSTPTSLNMGALVAGDFDGDGLLDLATAGPNLSDSILLGNGDGTFQAAAPFEATFYPRTYTVGDLNGDGTVDLLQFSTNSTTGTPPQTASVWLSTPVLSLTASSLQFGAQNLGSSSSVKTVLLSNAGNAALSVTKIAASGDFSQTNTCTNALAIRHNCSIQVTFTPTANGPRSGSLAFTDNAKASPQRLALTGWAGPPDFAPSVSPASVTVKAGSSATYSLILLSGDGFAGTVQVLCSGAPSGANCSLSQQSVPLSANTTARVRVIVNTTAPSSASLALPLLTASRSPDSTLLNIPPLSIVIVCALGWLALQCKHRLARLLPGVALCLVLAACGGGGSVVNAPPRVVGTPAGTYTLMLTIMSGSTSHTTTLTLVVQ